MDADKLLGRAELHILTSLYQVNIPETCPKCHHHFLLILKKVQEDLLMTKIIKNLSSALHSMDSTVDTRPLPPAGTRAAVGAQHREPAPSAQVCPAQPS